MSANRSTAVMQRRKVAPDSLDYFPTPPFATRALCELLEGEIGPLQQLRAWEPACGELHMAWPLAEYFGEVRASDVHRYTPAQELFDFTLAQAVDDETDVVISNPPFRLAFDFIEAGLRVARVATAMLVRSAFLEGQDRFAKLWSQIPPTFVLQFTERVVLLEGRLIQAGAIDPFAEKQGTKASSATAYVWLVWIRGRPPSTALRWLAPCRAKLERPGDYPNYQVEQLLPPAEGLFGEATA